MSRKLKIRLAGLLATSLLLLFQFSIAQDLIASAVKAPVSPDGNVAGAATDFLINFNIPFDPTIPGRTLLAGKTIKIVLPEAFTQAAPPAPVMTFATGDCAPPLTGQCSTGGLLQGWPQRPLPFGLYPLTFEEPNTLVFTAQEDVIGDPGIKQIHLLILGFRNPEPGTYDIQVLAETGPNGELETGTARLEILAEAIPNISPVSVISDAPGTNLIYQTTGVNQATPLPFDFLVWDHGGAPFTGITISDDGTRLLRDGQEVGQVVVEAPEGASGQLTSTEASSTEVNAPIVGRPTAHLRVHFRAGSEAGLYTVTFSLNDGNSLQMFVQAE